MGDNPPWGYNGYNGDSPPKAKFPKSLSCELDESIIEWKNINFLEVNDE